jgi:hypothetical protein
MGTGKREGKPGICLLPAPATNFFKNQIKETQCNYRKLIIKIENKKILSRIF